jgi:hypothetical protein
MEQMFAGTLAQVIVPPEHAFFGVHPVADAQAAEESVPHAAGVPAQAVPYAATTHPGAVEVQSQGDGVPTQLVADHEQPWIVRHAPLEFAAAHPDPPWHCPP